MKRLVLPVVLPLISSLLFTAACGIADDPKFGARTQPIVNGELHDGHPAVSAFRTSGGGSCTATLIGERTVLTAAHCTTPGAQHYFVLLGERWYAQKVISHPHYTNTVVANDIALAFLREAPPVTPAVIAALGPEVGQEVLLVGVGSTGPDGATTSFKRAAKNFVAEMDDIGLTYLGSDGDRGNLCYGDSGGPSFATINGQEVQVGIHSYLTSGMCGVDGVDMRVDPLLEWIVEESKGDVRVGGYPDVAAPKVQITHPTADTEVFPKTTIEVKVEDDIGILEVSLFVDDERVGTAIRAPYRFELELEPGPHTLRALATDLAQKENEATAAVVVVPYFAFGERCESAEQCATPICLVHPDLDMGYCTQRCRPEKPCPDGLACVAAGNDYLCEAPASLFDEGGCALSPRPESAPLWLLGFFALALTRRRRSR